MAWIGGLRGANLVVGGGVLLFSLILPGGAPPPKSEPTPPTTEAAAFPLIKKYCFSCHSGATATAGLDLSKFRSDEDILASAERWAKVSKYLASGQMPPKGQPMPTQAERNAACRAIDATLGGDCTLPAHVTLRRLNRFEYDNTIRDLTGVEFHPSEDFPSDDVGYGFDNIGDVLSISPLLMEKYLRAAQTIATRAIMAPEDRVVKYAAKDLQASSTVGNQGADGLVLFTNGDAFAKHTFAMAGQYRVKITMYGIQAGPDPVKIAVSVNGRQIVNADLTATAPTTFEYPIQADQGVARIAVTFLNDYYNPKSPLPRQRDRNMVVNSIEVQGPLGGGGTSLSHNHLIPPGSGVNDLRQILSRIASQAYRRPVRPDELARVVALARRALDGGESFERSVQLGLTAILVSPSFLFKVENVDPKKGLDGYQLATRLSYFLWGSMPDDDLTELAANGQLLKPTILRQQVERMLKDPKASALSDGFAAQWLELRKLQTITLDPKTFPKFSLALRNDMTKETKAFFTNIVQQNRPVTDFFDADYTFLNQRLADLYGIQGVEGDQFRRVQLPEDRRSGVLSQASFLMVTSNPTRTSPVKRGKWVLENLLGTPPPPPPPNVGDLGDSGTVLNAATLRERMEVHRKKPECAVCHAKLDPIGFSLENYDALGRWRESDAGAKIDNQGVLPDGTKFEGGKGLREILMKGKDQFVRCLAEKLMTYALGRGLVPGDSCVLDAALKAAKSDGYRFSSLVRAIVFSTPFTMQKEVRK